MPQKTEQTITPAVSAYPAIPMDRYQSPFNVGFGVTKSLTGDVTFSVQHTFDRIQDSTVTPTWFDHSTVSGKTTSIDGNYAYPVEAIRLNVTAVSGTSSVKFQVLQTGQT